MESKKHQPSNQSLARRADDAEPPFPFGSTLVLFDSDRPSEDGIPPAFVLTYAAGGASLPCAVGSLKNSALVRPALDSFYYDVRLYTVEEEDGSRWIFDPHAAVALSESHKRLAPIVVGRWATISASHAIEPQQESPDWVRSLGFRSSGPDFWIDYPDDRQELREQTALQRTVFAIAQPLAQFIERLEGVGSAQFDRYWTGDRIDPLSLTRLQTACDLLAAPAVSKVTMPRACDETHGGTICATSTETHSANAVTAISTSGISGSGAHDGQPRQAGDSSPKRSRREQSPPGRRPKRAPDTPTIPVYPKDAAQVFNLEKRSFLDAIDRGVYAAEWVSDKMLRLDLDEVDRYDAEAAKRLDPANPER